MMQIYNANYNDVSELIQNFVLMAMETNTVAAVVKPNFLQNVRKAHTFRCGMDSTKIKNNVYVDIENIHIL